MTGLILLYHRIADLQADPQLLAVAPHRFEQHLETLRRDYHPITLGQMMTLLRDGQLPPRAVALTLDDGYADNAENAAPLLARHGTAATVFVTTSYLGGTREFWWDDLERLLLLPGRLPETLRLRIGSTVHTWDLGESGLYSEEDCARHRAWSVDCPVDPTPRHRVYRALCRILRTSPEEDRAATIEELSALAGAKSAGRETHRALSEDALGRLAHEGLVEVGAHTSTHPVLATLEPEEQRSEIAGSKSRLESITGLAVTSFAYPFGSRADYTAATVSAVRDAGFTLGCANVTGLVRRRSDPFQLPRVLVRNWDADAFAGRLAGWFGD